MVIFIFSCLLTSFLLPKSFKGIRCQNFSPAFFLHIVVKFIEKELYNVFLISFRHKVTKFKKIKLTDVTPTNVHNMRCEAVHGVLEQELICFESIENTFVFLTSFFFLFFCFSFCGFCVLYVHCMCKQI